MVVERFTARHPGGIASSWCTAHIPASVKKKCRNGVSDLYGRGRQWRTCALQGQVPQVSYALKAILSLQSAAERQGGEQAFMEDLQVQVRDINR